MSLEQRCADAIRKVGGNAAFLQNGERLEFAASIQPILGGLNEEADALGWDVVRSFHLYAPGNSNAHRLAVGDSITYAGGSYMLRRVDSVYFGNEVVYIHGLLQLEEGTL